MITASNVGILEGALQSMPHQPKKERTLQQGSFSYQELGGMGPPFLYQEKTSSAL
jgi:hypothetical protein